MDQAGFIKLFRKLLEWEWYTNSIVKDTFIHILLKANHTPKKWQGLEIERGQYLTSNEGLARELGLSIQNIRTALKKLKSTNDITIKSTNKNTLITVVNYSVYQDNNTDANKEINNQSNNQLTNNQHSTNIQLTTTKELKELKNVKNDKKKDKDISPSAKSKTNKTPKKKTYGEFNRVLLTEEEYQELSKLVKHVDGLVGVLDEYLEQTPKKRGTYYGNHFLMLKTIPKTETSKKGWCMKTYLEEHPEEKKKEFKREEPVELQEENIVSDDVFAEILAKYE